MKKSICLILLTTIFFASCDGQVKEKTSTTYSFSCDVQINMFNPFQVQAMKMPIGTPKLKKFDGATIHSHILCSLKDKNGHLWFGSTGGGVYRYDGKEFLQFTTQEGLSHNDVLSLCEDKNGLLWIGTSDGVSVWNGTSFKNISITTIRGKNAIPYKPPYKNPDFGTVSLDNTIDEIIQDSKGNLWFGGGKGLFRYDGKIFTNFTINDGIPNNTGIEISWVEKIVEDTDGNIWFGGRIMKGLFKYDGKTLINIKPDKEEWLRPLLRDENGMMWFGNWGRIYKSDGKTFTQSIEKENACFYSVFQAFKDGKGNIWVGGDSKGNEKSVCFYDGKTFKYIPITEDKGKIFIGSITEDNKGNIWITSGLELYRYDGKELIKFSE